MAYVRTIWKNREVERPRTYEKIENPDGTITLIPSEGTIIEEGTPIIAANMNNIEQGIEAAHNAIDELGSAAYTESSAYAPSSHISVSASTSAKGHVQLTDSVSSTSTTTAATPNSVKQAYDKANAALPKTGGTMTGILTAQSNTSYTVRQVRNIILSTADANVDAMQNGDIWIKYK